MKIIETIGWFLGFPLGLFTGTVSFLRSSRMFHPNGIIVLSEVHSLTEDIHFPDKAILRFSSAWWKQKEWMDVLGISIRFGANGKSVRVRPQEQDLLFASFERPWQIGLGPLITDIHDFFYNDYFSVSPFYFKNLSVEFKLTPKFFHQVTGSRVERLLQDIEDKAELRLWMRKIPEKEWFAIADIKLSQVLSLDQEELKFNPFQNGLEIYPKGFIQHLRVGSYRLSQWGRNYRHHIARVLELEKRQRKNEASDNKEDSMQVSEIMHKGVTSVNLNDSVRRVAELMRQEDVGAVPIMENNRPIGIVTDRDIVVSCVAEGYSMDKPISHAMNEDVICVKENQDVEVASQLMKDNQVSRVLVVDSSERPIGMVSLQDLTKAQDRNKQGEVLNQIKQ